MACEVFAKVREVKKSFGAVNFGKIHFVKNVGRYGGEQVIAAYMGQGGEKKYEGLHKAQLTLGVI
jgi:hypothetical protein